MENFCVGGSVNNNNTPLDLSKDHCNKTVEIYEDVSSPEVTQANRNRPLLCTYRFRSFRGAPRDWVLRLRFKKFKVGTIVNATHCAGGYLQVNEYQTHWLFFFAWEGYFYYYYDAIKVDSIRYFLSKLYWSIHVR